jgi:dephospho-CoA kinase
VIGITGAVAAGKSTAARMLADTAGGIVISADDIGHELLVSDPEIRRRLLDHWGNACLDDRGEIDRERLASIVFSDPEELAELNRIIHPGILKRMRRQIEAMKEDPSAWIVVDAALLFETGLDEVCDVKVFVEASVNVREQRARQSRGWDAEELTRREKAQMPPERKCNLSDYKVNNNGNKHETQRQIERIVKLIKRHRRKTHGQLENGESLGCSIH